MLELTLAFRFLIPSLSEKNVQLFPKVLAQKVRSAFVVSLLLAVDYIIT
jgi:hypothetical protein